MNAGNFKESEKNNPPGWTCEEWSNFWFEWETAWGASFQDAADVAIAKFNECQSEELQTAPN